MKKTFRIITATLAASVFLLTAVSCDVHEFPELPESRPHVIRLSYETGLPIWDLDYTLQGGVTSKGEIPTKSVLPEGRMRYIIRTFPVSQKSRSANSHIQEFIFTKDISEGYNAEFKLDMYPGEYRIMVWSDMMENPSDEPFYDYGDFAGITVNGEHRGNTDYRDAFRGYADFMMEASIIEETPDTTDVRMERPLAKFEFISTDLMEFITDEQTKADIKSKQEANGEDVKSTKVDASDYNVVIHYSGFMPYKFSMFGDKPVDSATGVSFHSDITQINESEASIGFDYVFVNHKQTSVSVQVGIYNKEGERLSVSNPIDVPLKRSYHSILKGKFLTQKTSEGIIINPDFDGDHNIIL